MEVRETWGDVLLTPPDTLGDDVETLLHAFDQVGCEGNCHTTDATPDIENNIVGLKIGKLSEVVEELVPHLLEVSRPDEDLATGRD